MCYLGVTFLRSGWARSWFPKRGSTLDVGNVVFG